MHIYICAWIGASAAALHAWRINGRRRVYARAHVHSCACSRAASAGTRITRARTCACEKKITHKYERTGASAWADKQSSIAEK